MTASSMVSQYSTFHQHLQALTGEFERILAENLEMRKELHNEPMWLLRSLEMEGSKPPMDHIHPSPRQNTRKGTNNSSQLRVSGSSSPRHSPRGADNLPLPGSVELESEHTRSKSLGEQRAGWHSSECFKVPAIEPEGQPPASHSSLHSKETSLREFKGSSGSASAKVHEIEEFEAAENVNFLLLLDMVPACVIFASTVVAGVSADIEPDSIVWKVLEAVFTAFFIGEIVVKMKYFGFSVYLFGSDWYWSWFDILCVILALIDMGLTYVSIAEGVSAETGPVNTLKMLKLARLGRIIRLLKFKIFQELKLMIQGVFTGLRVLFWAVVLLVGCMYLIGVVTKTLFGQERQEFRYVPIAMFTAFRCFTDGCTTEEGEPLHEKLRDRFGGLFMLAYILLFLFVTIGIFNLIMAVFIDNVTDGSTKKRQRELGANAPRTAWVLSSVLRHLILTNIFRREAEDEAAAEEDLLKSQATGGGVDVAIPSARRRSKILQEKLLKVQALYGYNPHTTQEYDELTASIRADMSTRNVQVTRGEFNHWLSTEKELLETLADAEIDLSCKSDLFDVLDADLSGVLEFEEMIDGLLKCRGPASKTDIIAIRLKTSLLVNMMTRLCRHMGVDGI
mmetsp:Transcript_54811/g.119933  ORF Transcript_54811/g.119933 Transcript_54811/m.119933 type:complete len:620 (+) Transcript_54811:69-1928(+)